jgi:hypothetical protein
VTLHTLLPVCIPCRIAHIKSEKAKDKINITACIIFDRDQIEELGSDSERFFAERELQALLARPSAARSPGEIIMFGFQGGESAGTVARKKGYMQDAQQRWGFMTNFDLSTIKNEVQLSSMVKDRSGISETQAKSDVQAWMQDKEF